MHFLTRTSSIIHFHRIQDTFSGRASGDTFTGFQETLWKYRLNTPHIFCAPIYIILCLCPHIRSLPSSRAQILFTQQSNAAVLANFLVFSTPGGRLDPNFQFFISCESEQVRCACGSGVCEGKLRRRNNLSKKAAAPI